MLYTLQLRVRRSLRVQTSDDPNRDEAEYQGDDGKVEQYGRLEPQTLQQPIPLWREVLIAQQADASAEAGAGDSIIDKCGIRAVEVDDVARVPSLVEEFVHPLGEGPDGILAQLDCAPREEGFKRFSSHPVEVVILCEAV